MERVIDNAVFVVVSPRMPSLARSTGEGGRTGTRIEEVKQLVLTESFLRPLTALKSRSRRCLFAQGTAVSSMGAWFIPKPAWPAVKIQLDEISAKWQAEATKLQGQLDQQLEELVEAYPEDEDGIRANAMTEDQFRKSTRFVYTAFHMSSEQFQESASLDAELSGLSVQVIDDLRKVVFESGRRPGSSFDKTVLKMLGVMRDKARGFAFVDQAIERLADELEEIQSILNEASRLDGVFADLVSGVMMAIEFPEQVLRIGLNQGQLMVEAGKEIAKRKADEMLEKAAQSVQKPVRKNAKNRDASPASAGEAAAAGSLATKHNPVCI